MGIDNFLFNKITKSTPNFNNITDFSQIESDFLKIYFSITNQPFNNKIIILPESEIYKYTNGSTAAIKKKYFLVKIKFIYEKCPFIKCSMNYHMKLGIP